MYNVDMADDILKAYGQPRETDVLMDILLTDPELGFNPYVWMSRRLILKTLERNASNPGIVAAYEHYRQLLKRMNTEEMLKGQAFGL